MWLLCRPPLSRRRMKTIVLSLAAAPALAFVPTAPLSTPTQAGLEVAPRAPRQVRLARGMG